MASVRAIIQWQTLGFYVIVKIIDLCFFFPLLVTSALKWIGQDYDKHTAKTRDTSWKADCRVSNSSIKVKLTMEQRTVAWKRVTLDGQIFTIHKVERKDSGTYSCIAPNNPELRKKQLTRLIVYHYTGNFQMIYNKWLNKSRMLRV